MVSYIIKRIIQIIPVLWGITLVVFLIIHATPGDPATLMLGPDATTEQIEIIRRQMGLDRPLHIQYLTWLQGVMVGDWGISVLDDRPVLTSLLRLFPNTFELLIASMIVTVGIGLPTGVLSAIKRDSLFDQAGRAGALVGICMPNFWLGLMLMLLLAYRYPILPVSGRGTTAHLILPAITLGIPGAATVTRMCRSSMLDIIGQDYIRTARAKGLSERVVVYKHALKNSLIPVITIIGLQLGFRLGGTVIVETVFAYPGIGRFAYQRLLARDLPVIMGNLLLFAGMFCLVNLIVDVMYGFIDPRIRYD